MDDKFVRVAVTSCFKKTARFGVPARSALTRGFPQGFRISDVQQHSATDKWNRNPKLGLWPYAAILIAVLGLVYIVFRPTP